MKTRSSIVVLAITLPLSLAACGSTGDATPSAAQAPAASSTASETSSLMPTTDAGTDTMDPASQVFGAACSAVPKDGKGSFGGMATDPVATAASNNPLLSTLVTAVKTAGLVDTLNSAPGVTVFAPTNDAFARIPAGTLKKVLADKPTLTKVLTNHVLAGKLAPDQLAGPHTTLAGTELDVQGAGEMFAVGKQKAKVLCGNVPTANATVYIVDRVLLP